MFPNQVKGIMKKKKIVGKINLLTKKGMGYLGKIEEPEHDFLYTIRMQVFGGTEDRKIT